MTNFSTSGDAPVTKTRLDVIGLGPAAFWRDDGTRWAVIESGAGGYFCYDTRRTDTLSGAEEVTVASNCDVAFS